MDWLMKTRHCNKDTQWPQSKVHQLCHSQTAIKNAKVLEVNRLTIRIQLIGVSGQSAVVLIIWDTIIVIIMVTGISLAVLVMVRLVGIRDVGAVVQVVLVSVLIDVLVTVTLVAHAVVIRIHLGVQEGSFEAIRLGWGWLTLTLEQKYITFQCRSASLYLSFPSLPRVSLHRLLLRFKSLSSL